MTEEKWTEEDSADWYEENYGEEADPGEIEATEQQAREDFQDDD